MKTSWNCPECESEKIAVTAEQMWMVNTGDHYCHSVKPQDDDAKALCLDCRWEGERHQLQIVETDITQPKAKK